MYPFLVLHLKRLINVLQKEKMANWAYVCVNIMYSPSPNLNHNYMSNSNFYFYLTFLYISSNLLQQRYMFLGVFLTYEHLLPLNPYISLPKIQ